VTELLVLVFVGLLKLDAVVQDLVARLAAVEARLAAVEASRATSFVIRDATGFEIGPLLGFNTANAAATILQHPDGRLFYTSVDRRHLGIEGAVWFTEPDCSGTPYIESGGGEHLFQTGRLVLVGPPTTYYTEKNTVRLQGLAHRSRRVGTFEPCNNWEGFLTNTMAEAEIVTDMPNLQAPFTVQRK
jgi:hypothetical protein